MRNFLRVVTALLILAYLSAPAISIAQMSNEPQVHAVLFFSPSCSHCHYVISEVLTPMMDDYGDQLQIIGIDTAQPGGGQLYQVIVERFQIPPNRQGVPTLIVGDVVLVGSQEIPEQFPALVQEGIAAGGIGWPDIPELAELISQEAEITPSPTPTPVPTTLPTTSPAPVSSGSTTHSDVAPVYLAYFSDPSCLICAQVSADLEQLHGLYPNLVVREFDIRQEAALNEAMCEKYNVPDEYRLMAPMVFIGQECLTSDEITFARLQTLIESPAAELLSPPWIGLDAADTGASAGIVERFRQYSLLAVIGAGLLDGVNPCAFTTIIFFVSYLALVGRKGRDILFVGAAFTFAVFLTYLMMGLGLAELIRHIGSFRFIGRVIYGATAIICLVLAGISLYDYIKIRQGRTTEISLQLPLRLKKRIHQTIRTHSRMKGYIGAAFGAGILVSVFELACTGQVYLPTIIFVTGVADLRLTAIIYLILYNLMFVVPLAAVFLITYLGASSRRITDIFQANVGSVKLLTAILFSVLGLWLGYVVWIG